MSKELEALYYLLTEAITNGDGTNKVDNEHVRVCYDMLTKAITPPTADEVCKALSEYLSRGVKKDKDNNFYYSEQKQYYGECDEIICGYGWEHEHHTIAFEFDLPPHLITLIGRFYQSLEGDNNATL